MTCELVEFESSVAAASDQCAEVQPRVEPVEVGVEVERQRVVGEAGMARATEVEPG